MILRQEASQPDSSTIINTLSSRHPIVLTVDSNLRIHSFTYEQWIRSNESTVSQLEIPLMMTDHCSEISKFNLLSIIIKIPVSARIRT